MSENFYSVSLDANNRSSGYNYRSGNSKMQHFKLICKCHSIFFQLLILIFFFLVWNSIKNLFCVIKIYSHLYLFVLNFSVLICIPDV